MFRSVSEARTTLGRRSLGSQAVPRNGTEHSAPTHQARAAGPGLSLQISPGELPFRPAFRSQTEEAGTPTTLKSPRSWVRGQAGEPASFLRKRGSQAGGGGT